jgi:hypothetical protein
MSAMSRSLIVTLCLLAYAGGRADDQALLDEARRIAASVPPRLLTTLQEEISKGGFEGAIRACRDFAPKLAAQASAESGWAIRRVSLRNRNPKAVPDAWERAVLEEFDRRAAVGESLAALEKGEAVGTGAALEYRYLKALPTQELCLACHGPVDRISPAVRTRLAELYPQDRAMGYRVGEIRGALTLRKPLAAHSSANSPMMQETAAAGR